MEKNILPLMFSRIALAITLFIWFVFLTVGLVFLYYLIFLFILFLIPTILNIKISYKKHYEDNNPLPLILITLFLYISFGVMLISLFPDYYYIRILCVFFVPQTIFLILACLALKKYNKIANILKRINESNFKLKNNTFPLFLTRISLVITLPYIGWLVTIFESSSLYSSVENWMDMIIEYLPFHLAAVVTATVFNIFISLEQTINESMIMTTISIYVISGMLGELFFPSTVIISIIQVILLVFALATFKNKDN